MSRNNWLVPIRRFFKLIAEDKKDIWNIYIFALFSGAISLTLPLGVQAIINIIMGGRMASSWVLLVIIVLVGTALVGFLQILQLSVTEIIQQRIFVRSAFEFSYRIPRLKLSKIASDHPPELVNRFFDTLNLQKGLPKIITDFPTALLQILFGLILLSIYHPVFIVFGILLIALLLLILVGSGPRGLRSSIQESTYKYKVAHWLEELARTLTTFKLAGKNDLAEDRTDELTTGYLRKRKMHFKVLIRQYSYVVIFKVLITGALLFIGGFLVVENQINIGQFVAAEIVIITILNSSEKLIQSLDTIYDVLTALEKLGNVMDIDLDRSPENAIEMENQNGGYEVEMIDFALPYQGYGEPKLQQINLKINKGEKVCVSGKEGSGKTALLHGLAALHNDYSGNLVYNGNSLRSLHLESLRSEIGDNFSMEELFDGTLAENICLGNKTVTAERMLEVLKMVGLERFVNELPEGLLTRIVPGGRRIPFSITSRIILCRSIVQNPSLVLLDNFPLSYDFNFRALINIITSQQAEWTCVIASNHRDVASNCDRLIVMDEGKIVFEGSYEKAQQLADFQQIFHQ